MINILGTFCYGNYCLERADALLLIIPIFFILAFLLFKDFIKFKTKQDKNAFRKKNRFLRIFMLITRSLIIFMVIVSLAFPLTLALPRVIVFVLGDDIGSPHWGRGRCCSQ